MRLATYLMAAAIAGAPVVAAPANPAARLSVAKSVQVGTPVTARKHALGGGIVVAVLAAAAVIAGIVVAEEDNKTDRP